MANTLETRFPGLAIPRAELVASPTPVSTVTLDVDGIRDTLTIKLDNLTSGHYGGNKVRKLEYLLARAKERGVDTIATFGAVASNHAVATSLFAQRAGFRCQCFLAHQTRTAAAGRALNMHLKLGSEVVRYGGDRSARIAVLRKHLAYGATDIVPLGGTCWLGAIGFVNAGLELAEQIAAGELEEPDLVYVAMGTMGTVAGLALGLALANVSARVQAVRVTAEETANPVALHRLVRKTAGMMRRLDASIPDDLSRRVAIDYRPEFFGAGYAKTNPETDRAVAVAAGEMGLALEATYTGKAFRALLEDREQDRGSKRRLFWNTYNSVPLEVTARRPAKVDGLPESFLSYFDD